MDELILNFKSLSTNELYDDNNINDYIYEIFVKVIYPIETVKNFLNIDNINYSNEQKYKFYSVLYNSYINHNDVIKYLVNEPQITIDKNKNSLFQYEIRYLINFKMNIIKLNLTNETLDYQLYNTTNIESFFIKKVNNNGEMVSIITPKIII
jgi:hypothetical protein